MSLARIALAAVIGLALAAPVATLSFAEESRGAAAPDAAKTPRKKDRDSAQTPSSPGAPGTKPESAKIIFF